MAEWGGGNRIAKLRAIIIDRHGRTCWKCRKPIAGKVIVGHVVPRHLGGGDDLDNLRPECAPCSNREGAAVTQRINAARKRRPSRIW